MTTSTDDPRASLRRSVYLLLIFLSAGTMLGRIIAVDAVDRTALQEDRVNRIPQEIAREKKLLQAMGVNGHELDERLQKFKARLQTRPSLCRPFFSANDRSRWCTVRALVEDDMRVEGAPYAIDKVIQQPNWDTIDMVQHDGHLFSSKPPLLPTLMAAVYWPICRLTGMTLGTHPYEIGRFMLVLFNLIPMIVYLVLLAKLVERFGTTDWGRIFVMAAAAFGTFLSTFAVTINNHLPAAICALAAVYAAVRIWFDDERRMRYFVVAGLFGALAAVNEFPATAFLAVLTLALLWKAPRPTLLGYVPAVLLVAVAFFGTNWIAHQSLKPAYLHRSGTDNWYDYTYERNGRTKESYWKNPVGVDRGEPSWPRYATNVLVGHHGIFSLTPVWLLSVAGMALWIWRAHDPRLRWLAAAIAVISLACLAFYLGQPVIHRNYGGVTSGLRWMFWFAPLWLLAMLPAADAMAGRRWARGTALVLLALSVLSASYPTWNPWTHPWMMNYLHYMGWS
jgi:hypothetical protein